MQLYRLYQAIPPLQSIQAAPIRVQAAQEVQAVQAAQEVQAVQAAIQVPVLQAEPMQVQKLQVQKAVQTLLPAQAQAKGFRRGRPADLKRANNKEA